MKHPRSIDSLVSSGAVRKVINLWYSTTGSSKAIRKRIIAKIKADYLGVEDSVVNDLIELAMPTINRMKRRKMKWHSDTI